MRISGRATLPKGREELFGKLLDPEFLRRSIPGCEELLQGPDGDYSARIAVPLGLVRVSLKGTVTLREVVRPERYTVEFQGKGATGSLQGTLRVVLESSNCTSTEVLYDCDARFGGLLYPLNSRLKAGALQGLLDRLFSSLEKELQAE